MPSIQVILLLIAFKAAMSHPSRKSDYSVWNLVSTNDDVVVVDYCALSRKSELVNHIPKTIIGFSCCQRLLDIRQRIAMTN